MSKDNIMDEDFDPFAEGGIIGMIQNIKYGIAHRKKKRRIAEIREEAEELRAQAELEKAKQELERVKKAKGK